MREKLIEILRKPIFPHELADPTEAVADYLLDNGVTIQKWIPVTERLPERGKKVLCYHKFSGEEWTDWEDTIAENTFNGFCVGGERKAVWDWQGDFVTHWMPLPEPPKEGVNDGCK